MIRKSEESYKGKIIYLEGVVRRLKRDADDVAKTYLVRKDMGEMGMRYVDESFYTDQLDELNKVIKDLRESLDDYEVIEAELAELKSNIASKETQVAKALKIHSICKAIVDEWVSSKCLPVPFDEEESTYNVSVSLRQKDD